MRNGIFPFRVRAIRWILIYICIILLCLVLSENWGCSKSNPVEQSKLDSFFPLAIGLKWKYVNVIAAEDSFQIFVTKDTVIQGNRYFEVLDSGKKKLLRWNQKQQLIIWDTLSNRDKVFLDFAVSVNDSSGEEGYVLVSKTDTVSTLTGNFSNCYTFSQGLPFIIQERSYAKSIGLVQLLKERGARQSKYVLKSYMRQ